MNHESETVTAATSFVVAKNVAKIQLVIDPGNQITAWLAVDDGGDVKIGSFPSVLSLRGANSTRLLRERGESTLRPDEYVIGRTDATGVALETYVGTLAYQADAWANTRGSADRYSDPNWNLYLVETAAALAAPTATTIIADIVTMLPPGIWADQQAAVKAMILNGGKPHTYTMSGRAIELSVQSVTVEREAHVAWWALPEDARGEGLSLIFDWGGGTVNALLVDQTGASERQPMTFDRLGLETVIDDVSSDLDRPLTVGERETLKTSLAAGETFCIYVHGATVDVSRIARSRLAQAAAQIGAIIKPKFSPATLAALRRIYLIGGTANIAASEMRDVFSRIEVPETAKPELLNVLGAAFKNTLIVHAPEGSAIVAAPKKKRSRK